MFNEILQLQLELINTFKLLFKSPNDFEEAILSDGDGKAWINVEAYDICVQEDQQGTREAAENLGQLPEQQNNETAATYYEELLKSMDAEGMDICIEMNAQYADAHDVPNP